MHFCYNSLARLIGFRYMLCRKGIQIRIDTCTFLLRIHPRYWRSQDTPTSTQACVLETDMPKTVQAKTLHSG